MADLQKYNDVPLDKGLFDGLHTADVPPGGFSELQGYDLEYGWPMGERGRLKRTSSEVRAGKPFRDGFDWHRPDGSIKRLAVADGGIFNSTADDPRAYTELVSKLTCGGTASVAQYGVTVTGTGTKWLHSVRPGDMIWLDADTINAACEVETVVSQEEIILKESYDGAGGSGAYTVWRKLNDGTVSLAVTADGRLFVSDGVGPLHWFGDDGRGTDVFRPAGMMKPTTHMVQDWGTGGALSAGEYFWLVAFQDARGNVGPAIATKKVTATADQSALFNSLPEGSAWAVAYVVYRPIVDTNLAYSIVKDITAKLSSIAAYDAGNNHTILTLDTKESPLTSGQHTHRRLVFSDGNVYIVKQNSTTTIHVHGDASAEDATAWITIAGGFDIDKAGAGVIRDYTADADLNFDHPASGTITNTTRSYNEPPPVGLQYVTTFDGGSRLVAYEEGTCVRAWFSGRPPIASKTGQPDFGGRLDFDSWPHFQDVGPANGDEVQGFIELGRYVFAPKLRSVWELHHDGDDCAAWGWGPVPQAENIGCCAPKSIVVHGGVAWWFGFDSNRVELIRFEGYNALGFLRPRLNGTLDGVTNPETATAAVHEGYLYLSVDTDDDSENDLTVRLHMKGNRVDEQPWGCGVFVKRFGEAADALGLLCGSPEVNESEVYEVLGSTADNGGDIARKLVTGEISGEKGEEEIIWSHLLLEVVTETP